MPFVDMLKAVGGVLGIVILVALWVIPNPIGRIAEIWRFFRGD